MGDSEYKEAMQVRRKQNYIDPAESNRCFAVISSCLQLRGWGWEEVFPLPREALAFRALTSTQKAYFLPSQFIDNFYILHWKNY